MLSPGEKIVFLTRKHWFTFFKQLIPLAFLLLLPFILYIGWEVFAQSGLAAEFEGSLSVPPQLALFIFLSWLLVLWMRFFVIWSDHHLDMWIITEGRILDVEQTGFFTHRNVSCELNNIQNITVEVKGFYQTILDFGNIEVETAGESSNLTIQGVPHPEDIKEMIMRQTKVMRATANDSAPLEANPVI